MRWIYRLAKSGGAFQKLELVVPKEMHWKSERNIAHNIPSFLKRCIATTPLRDDEKHARHAYHGVEQVYFSI